jgi:hypothetical protein
VNVPISKGISIWSCVRERVVRPWRRPQPWNMFGLAPWNMPGLAADTTGAELTLAAIAGTAIAVPERSVAPAAKRGKVTFMVSVRAIRMTPP